MCGIDNQVNPLCLVLKTNSVNGFWFMFVLLLPHFCAFAASFRTTVIFDLKLNDFLGISALPQILKTKFVEP